MILLVLNCKFLTQVIFLYNLGYADGNFLLHFAMCYQCSLENLKLCRINSVFMNILYVGKKKFWH